MILSIDYSVPAFNGQQQMTPEIVTGKPEEENVLQSGN